MVDPPSKVDPRWGAEQREEKAQGILHTLLAIEGAEVLRGTWVDVGCGSGAIAADLAGRVDRIVGIDPEAWSRWPDLSRAHANLRFHAGSYRDLAAILSPASVDVAVCNQVYEHVDSPPDLLACIHRVLRSGGICYFAGPNLLWPIEPHVHLPFVHWIPRAAAIRLLQWVGGERHRDLDAHSLDFWRLRRLFGRTGFSARSAFAARARAGVDLGDTGLAMRAAASMPGIVERAMQPLLPGFVYVLRKI